MRFDFGLSYGGRFGEDGRIGEYFGVYFDES